MSSSTSSSDPSPLRRGLVALTATLLPLAVLSGTTAVLHEVAATRGGDIVEKVDERLVDGVGDLVLFGNSVARTGVDAEALGRDLLPFVHGVTSLAIDGTFPAHWYAILEHDVFGRGYRPRTVVLYSNASTFEQVEIDRIKDRASFLRLPGADSPVLVQHMFGGQTLRLLATRLSDARFTVREAMVDGLVHGTVGLAFPDPGPAPLTTRGKARVDRASRVLFGKVGQAQDVVAAAPIAAADQGPVPVREPGSRESLLPDFAALCVAHNARLVVVAAPSRPQGRTRCGDDTIILPYIALVGTLPIDLVDLSRLPVPEEFFQTGFHVTAEGTPIVTAGLAMALLESGAVQATPTEPGARFTARCPRR